MTREESNLWKNEIAAFQNGKKIQVQIKGMEHWVDCENPSFSYGYIFRIKSEHAKRLPTIQEVEQWFLENRVFSYKNTRTRISHIDLRESERSKCIYIADVWVDIEKLVNDFTHYDGSELYITEN